MTVASSPARTADVPGGAWQADVGRPFARRGTLRRAARRSVSVPASR